MNTILNSALTLTYNQLSAFSGLDNFWQVFDTAFGTQYNRSSAEILRLQWQAGNFSQLPQIEILDSSTLGNANGAYATRTNKIYLLANFIATSTPEAISAVLLEEIGHFIDAQINQIDTLGDEGEKFSALVRGQNLTTQELDRINTENDSANITVDGKIIAVEQAAPIVLTVTTTADQNDGSATGGLSLRDAILIANADTTNDYIIELQGGQTYSLIYPTTDYSSGSLNIQRNVTIRAVGNQPAIIDGSKLTYTSYLYGFIFTFGNDIFRVRTQGNLTLDNITVTKATDTAIYIESNASVLMQNSTVSYSSAASSYENPGIENNGTLTLQNSRVHDNTANGIINYGTAVIHDSGIYNNKALGASEISNSGGGILNFGSVLLDNSQIFDNQALGGSGIKNKGSFTGINSVIGGNSGGGGINNDGKLDLINTAIVYNISSAIEGAGLTNSGTANLINTTISNNSMSGIGNGGGIYNDGILNLVNSTVANNTASSNGGGIYSRSGGQITLKNTIVASNSANLYGKDIYGSVTGNNNNLIGNLTGSSGTVGTGTDIVNPNPGLGTLQAIGNTYIHPLLAGSPAINGGNNSLIAADTQDLDSDQNTTEIIPFDQRNSLRIFETTVDIGAVEMLNDAVFTPIESAGNTKLVKDPTNKYFTQIGTNTPTAIKNGGQQIYQNIYTGWQTLAAETVNGDNQVLWKNTAGTGVLIWHLDANWNWVSSEGQYALNSADAFTQETKFGIDTNGDGIIGNPYTTIEAAGNTKLVKDFTNKYFTQIGTNTPIAIKNGGQQIYQDIYTGWQTLAAETVNGVNQVLWKNTAGTGVLIWHLDANWNWVFSEGQYALNSADAFTQETKFGIDTNGDGIIGNPYTTIEAAGNTKLVKDFTNKYFTQIGTNTPIAIKNGGQQIYQNIYTGWQTLAAETVNGVNQVLWKNTAGTGVLIWHLDANWNWVSSEGQYALNSADAFTQETKFGIDTNGDGIIGNPYTTIEAAGNTKLVKDFTNKYFTQIGTNTPIAIKNGEQQIYQDIYTGWQTLAAETVNGDNQVLWKNTAGTGVLIWHLDANWNWVFSEGQYALNSADAFTQETKFGIDTNGDGVIGNPAGNPYILIESTGNTKLVKDPTNKYFTQIGINTPTAIKNGGQQIYQDIYAGWQTLAAETVNGDNQVLWKNVSGNFLTIWHLDSNWNLLSGEGQYALNSVDAFTQETNFGIDANGDGVIGNPVGNPYIPIESVGNTKLVKDAANKYFAKIGTNTPTAIKNGGQQIYQDIYTGWQTLAAETVNGDNQVLWQNTAGNSLLIWHLDSNWNWVSSEGQFGLNSAAAFTQETNFGIDTNGDGIIGNPYTTIEAAGNTKLVKDTANKYFAQVGIATPIAIQNSGVQIFPDIYPGWQTLAVETVNGDNQVLWKNNAGNYLHIWHLDNSWNRVSSEGQFGLNSANAFTQETNFSIDANGDGIIGNPYILVV